MQGYKKEFLTVIVVMLFVQLCSIVSLNAQPEDHRIPKGQLLPVPLIKQSKSLATYFETVVYEENSESEVSDWNKQGVWEVGVPTSDPWTGHESSNCAATNLSGEYSNNVDGWLISPSISLPVVTYPSSQLKLNFWEWFERESGYDHGKVKVSTDGGTTWTELDDRSGSSDWRQTVIDLSSYAVETIKLSFHFTSDASVTYSGWYVDDVQITLEEPQPLEATLVSLNHQNFPFIYMNVAVDTFRVGVPDLTQSNFQVYENGVLQSDYFEVTPPEAGGAVRLADIIFVLDVSSSMAGEISAVKNNMTNFIDTLAASGINYGVGFVLYANDNYVYNNGNLYLDQSDIISIINQIELDEHGVGIGNRKIPEDGFDALYTASLMNFRPGTQKILILITDAPCHYANDRIDYPSQDEGDLTNFTLETIVSLLKNKNITCFVVGPDSETDAGLYTTYGEFISMYPRYGGQFSGPGSLTDETNGKFYVVTTDFQGIVQNIATTVGNTYVVTYKSSNPLFDGTVRHVEVRVYYAGNEATCEGSYIPGSAPRIQRTQTTIDLHNRAWAEGTEFTIEAEIVDNVVPYVQSVTLYYRNTGVATYSSTNMNLYSGNTYQGTIPGGAVQTPGLDYYITATDGENTASDPSVDPINNPYQFGVLPNVAPAITHTPITTLTPDTPIPINAEIVDNTNYVASAKLYYRKTAQLIYHHVDMTNIGGNNYEGVIPATYVTNDGVEYYLRAEDDFGVSGHYGTRDVPISMMNPLFYVSEKEVIINCFLGENFYVDVEQDAQNLTDQLEEKINAGTATNKDIEALRRLTLVEEASKVAYPGAVKIAQLSSKATLKASVALILAAAFGELQKVLEPVKDVPVLKWFYDAAKGAKEMFSSFNISILKSMVGRIAGNLWPKLMEWFPHLSQPEALSAADKIAWTIAPEIEKETVKAGFFELVSLQPIEDGLRDVYLSVYESGLPAGLLWVGGSERAIMFSISDAASQDFEEGNVNILTQTIRNVKEPSILTGNVKVENAISSKLDFAGTLGTIKLALLAIALLASIAAVIGGIIGCGPTGGIGCILSAIGGAGIFGTVKAILPFFSAAQIGLYSWGMGEGLYQLHYKLPNQLNEVQQIAFDKTAGPLYKELSGDVVNTMSFAPIPDHWADSLVTISNEVAQEIIGIKSVIQQNRWDEAGSKFELLSSKLKQLSSMQNVVNSVLDVSYLYNSSASVAGLDSIYHYTGAYTAANDIGLGFSQFAIGFALLVKPTGAQRDTLILLIDETISRLQAVGPAYQQTFNQFNSWGFQAPPIVSIIDYEIEESKGSYYVQCRIKNISDRAVHDVATSLKGPSDVDVRVTPETDTLFSILNLDEEKTLRWRVNYYGLDKVLILDLNVHPLVIPGDFHGDTKIISQLITETSPPTRGTLDNKNIYAYPNPFNPDFEEVTFRFKLANAGNVSIKIYDVSNRLVTTVISDIPMEANTQLAVKWDGINDQGYIVANGVYFYVIESSSGERAVGKVAILR